MGSSYRHNLALRFERLAEEAPGRPALLFPGAAPISYAELDRAGNRAARWLAEKGLRRGEIAAIRLEKDPAAFALWLGCIKLGATYVMLDALSPAARQERILATCGPKMLLCEDAPEPSLVECCRRLGTLILARPQRELLSEIEKSDGAVIPSRGDATGDDLAYLMFTSGSTGTPKGAAISQAGVANLIDWSAATFGISSADVLTGVNPLYFDNSVFDLYASLFNGAALAPAPRALVAEAGQLVDSLEKQGATLWFSVPSLLIYLMKTRTLQEGRLPTMRMFVFGGEGYPKPELQKLWGMFGARIRLMNVYGPTECTCICSAYEVSERDFGDMSGLPPLGKMAPNFSALVLDEELKAVSPGEAGELFLLGPNVGKGYYNDPERTSVAFIQNPLNAAYREIGYRTGDLVRQDPSTGDFWFVGRRDNQIKHMGYRIELEEIEAGLNSLPHVVECAVVYLKAEGGLGRIFGAVALSEQRDGSEIRNELRHLLPPYMIPAEIQVMQALPKNANGKVDRRQVREIFQAAAS